VFLFWDVCFLNWKKFKRDSWTIPMASTFTLGLITIPINTKLLILIVNALIHKKEKKKKIMNKWAWSLKHYDKHGFQRCERVNVVFPNSWLQIFTMSNVGELCSLVRYTQGILSNYPSTLAPLIFLTLALHVVTHHHWWWNDKLNWKLSSLPMKILNVITFNLNWIEPKFQYMNSQMMETMSKFSIFLHQFASHLSSIEYEFYWTWVEFNQIEIQFNLVWI